LNQSKRNGSQPPKYSNSSGHASPMHIQQGNYTKFTFEPYGFVSYICVIYKAIVLATTDWTHHHSTPTSTLLTNNQIDAASDLDVAGTQTVLGGLFVCGGDFERLLKILINDGARDDGVDDGV